MPTVTRAFSGGVEFVPAYGERDTIYFYGAWLAGEDWTINVSSSSGDFTLGKGNIAGLTFSCIGVISDRVYLGGGNLISFSAVTDPTGWEQQDVGAGNVTLMSQYGAQDDVRAITTFQGAMAVYGRRSVQTWSINADPLQFDRKQTLGNTGTIAGLSVQSLGDQDVLALSDYGVWSLRVRDASNNGYQVDMGAAIQLILQDKLLQCRAYDIANNLAEGTTAGKACSVVEPLTNRYWLFLFDTIYVLSYFTASNIMAWSTYTPTDQNGNVFTPQKFVIYQGQVFARGTYADGSEGLITYGGSDNNTYDNTKAIVETPWLSNKQPATNKQATGIDFIMDGKWTVSASMDYLESPTRFALIDTTDKPSPQGPMYPYTASGTHFKLQAICVDKNNPSADGRSHPPTFASFILHYEDAGE